MTVGECRAASNSKGYSGWHEWAEAQKKRGAKQLKCAMCMKWRFKPERCEHFAEVSDTQPTTAAAMDYGGPEDPLVGPEGRDVS